MFTPPLLNSANVWASTRHELEALYTCSFTGAMTVRTSILDGFPHNDGIHQYCFFDANTGAIASTNESRLALENTSSLNTLGYSPTKFGDYIEMVKSIEDNSPRTSKAVIYSVTGTSVEIGHCYQMLHSASQNRGSRWLMEINLSCPNIDGKPPPAYSDSELQRYLLSLRQKVLEVPAPRIQVGIKTPPYTHHGQFRKLVDTLLESTSPLYPCPISFITSTNTLGSCLVMDPSTQLPALNSSNGSGVGGLAGAALHPLSLGNVQTIRRMLDEHVSLKHIHIIGVGGVCDAPSFNRMRAAGANAVGVGTALGRFGTEIFERIMKGTATT